MWSTSGVTHKVIHKKWVPIPTTVDRKSGSNNLKGTFPLINTLY